MEHFGKYSEFYNETKYPTADLLRLVKFAIDLNTQACRALDVFRVRSTRRNHWYGRYYPARADGPRSRVVGRSIHVYFGPFDEDYITKINRHKTVEPIVLKGWEEAFIFIAAHEVHHRIQHWNWANTPREKRGRYKWSERDADAYAVARVKAYRYLQERSSRAVAFTKK